jgi:uridylate kinase
MLAAEVFGEHAVYPTVVKYQDYDALDENKKELQRSQVIIGAGKKAGHSTDVDALLFASFFGTNQVISLKNVDGIYTADPKVSPDAEKRKVMNWTEYRTIIKAKLHVPGASFPIDAIAAQLAEKMKIGFTVLHGRDFDAINEVVKTRLSSKGSVITPE